MHEFSGFPESMFDYVNPSEDIRVPIRKLMELKAVLTPKLRTLNSDLIGHVSRTKRPGTNDYNDWAWLYYSTIGSGAYRRTQLTVNISPARVYVGLNLRRSSEAAKFHRKIQKPEHYLVFNRIIDSLSRKEWIISWENENWEYYEKIFHSSHELTGLLQDPELYWINYYFDKGERILESPEIVDEIFSVFKILYNIYALAMDDPLIEQTIPPEVPDISEVELDIEDPDIDSDAEIANKIDEFISSLQTPGEVSEYSLPGRSDQYIIKRTAVEYNLKKHSLNRNGKDIVIISDLDLHQHLEEIFSLYDDFSELREFITELFGLPGKFLEIAYINPVSDARYNKTDGEKSILLNLARYNFNKEKMFWIFTVARELAYIRHGRLSYGYMKTLRELFMQVDKRNRKRG